VVEISTPRFPTKTLDQIPVLYRGLSPAVLHKIGGEFLRRRGGELPKSLFTDFLFCRFQSPLSHIKRMD
jgi:hypothetical protein